MTKFEAGTVDLMLEDLRRVCANRQGPFVAHVPWNSEYGRLYEGDEEPEAPEDKTAVFGETDLVAFGETLEHLIQNILKAL